jgi:hypothetical protein
MKKSWDFIYSSYYISKTKSQNPVFKEKLRFSPNPFHQSQPSLNSSKTFIFAKQT